MMMVVVVILFFTNNNKLVFTTSQNYQFIFIFHSLRTCFFYVPIQLRLDYGQISHFEVRRLLEGSAYQRKYSNNFRPKHFFKRNTQNKFPIFLIRDLIFNDMCFYESLPVALHKGTFWTAPVDLHDRESHQLKRSNDLPNRYLINSLLHRAPSLIVLF